MSPRISVLVALLAGAGLSCGSRNPNVGAGAATCATVEVLHPGVESGGESLVGTGRVDLAGRVETGPDGRALVHTDTGLALRLAGNTLVTFPDGRPRVERGRVFVTGWGDQERPVDVGPTARVQVGEAALEIERDVAGAPPGTRVIAVRGDVSFRQGSQQGQVAQGESLEGTSTLAVRPAGVWDDWTGGAASPQGMRPHEARGAARMWAQGQPGEGPAALALNEHRVRVTVRGDLAETVVEQRFFNGSDRAAPVEYRLRVPAGAIVRGFAVERNQQTLEGRPGLIASRNAAGGGAVALLGTHTPDELVAGLGYLSPGENVRVQLSYTAWLSRDGSHRAYVLPLGDPSEAPMVGEFSLDVDVSRAGARQVRIPEGARFAEGRILLRRSDWRPRGDVVIDLVDRAPPTGASARGFLSGSRGPDGHEHLLVDFVLPTASEAAQGTDLALVLDTSAATTPGALEVARAAVDAMLHQAGTHDRVALLLGDLGGRRADGEAGRMERVTPARREAILDAIAHARPGGASNLGRMIVDAQATLDARRNGAVFYLGDATPTVGTLDPHRLAEEVGRAAPDLRLYALSLGHESHPEVIAPLATHGGLVRRVEDATEAVAEATALLAHALRPCLRDVSFSLGPAVSHPLPTRLSAWVAGEPLRVVGELTGTAPRTVTVRARVGAEARTWNLPLRVLRIDDRGDLGRRWAQARVGALLGVGTGSASVAELGARYGLVTPVSGLVIGAEGVGSAGGYVVNAPVYDLDDLGARLPTLGVASDLSPRGVRGLGDRPEVPLATDDGTGWQPHRPGENRGLGGSNAVVAALGAAEPAARACVERKRALRPGLSGSVTVSATLNAEGRVTTATTRGSTLGDAETEACIRRAVAGITLPPLDLLGATPMTVDRMFAFASPGDGGRGLAARRCPATANLPRAMRRALWRERLGVQGATPEGARSLWDTALQRCELRTWEDRAALLEIVLDVLTDPNDVLRLRGQIDDPAAVSWLDGALARRFGPAYAWRAYHGGIAYVDWDSLLTRLADPRRTPEQRVTLLRAWLTVSPRDVDLRLRLLEALEALGRSREARAIAERLRRDPIADARVRGMVGEFFLRAGDRGEALRTFTEIAEFAPYDAFARGRLGDLLLTYGWPAEAYHQYQTLVALRPGDPVAPVRVALAALAAGREDEGLRTLRRIVEESGSDATGRMLQSILDGEVTRVTGLRPNDPAVRAWARVARQLRVGRETELVLRWTHPDLGVELRTQGPGETAFTTVGDAPLPVGLRVFSPDAALDGTRLLVRAAAGIRGGRSAEARVQLLVDAEGGARLVEQTVRFDATHRAFGFTVQGGRLVAGEVPPGEVPPLAETL